jgi:nicotinamide mononucleotide transporter
MSAFDIAEALAVALNLAYVALAIFESVLCWVVGLFGAVLTFVVFLHARLYPSTALQVVYMGLMVYGWYEWRRGGEKGSELAVSRTPGRWMAGLGATGIAFAAGLGWALRHGTDAALPFWDSGVTSFSLVAQFMTTRKWVESWLVWILVDMVYTGMLVSQGLHTMAALYIGYLVLAVLGLWKWRRSMAEARRREAS